MQRCKRARQPTVSRVRALVACGTTRRLAEQATAMISIRRGSSLPGDPIPAGEIGYILDDVLTYPFAASSFDAIVSVAALHHVDAAAGLEPDARASAARRDAGVVELARNRIPADLPRDLADRMLKTRNGYWNISAPTVWPSPGDLRRYAPRRRAPAARRALPPPAAVAQARRVMWRNPRPVIDSPPRQRDLSGVLRA